MSDQHGNQYDIIQDGEEVSQESSQMEAELQDFMVDDGSYSARPGTLGATDILDSRDHSVSILNTSVQPGNEGEEQDGFKEVLHGKEGKDFWASCTGKIIWA